MTCVVFILKSLIFCEFVCLCLEFMKILASTLVWCKQLQSSVFWAEQVSSVDFEPALHYIQCVPTEPPSLCGPCCPWFYTRHHAAFLYNMKSLCSLLIQKISHSSFLLHLSVPVLLHHCVSRGRGNNLELHTAFILD